MGRTEKKKIHISYRTFFILALGYLGLPMIIFFLAFLKIGWGLLFSAALLAAFILAARDCDKDPKGNKVLKDGADLTIGHIIFAAVFVLIWSFFAGIGDFTWVTADHTSRAATMNDLYNYDWPVFYDLSAQSNPVVRAALNGETVAFAYYFTFWLVPALVGKIAGSLVVARAALCVWGAIGLLITVLGMNMMKEKASLSAIIFLFIFGGFDIIPSAIQMISDTGSTWEGWNYELYIHGNFYQTMNVFNQCIPGWIVTLLVIGSKNNRSLGTLGALMFPYSPWATIGLLPIAVQRLLSKEMKSGDKKKDLRNIFGIGNLMVPVFIFILYASFYTANGKATAIKGFIWEFVKDPLELLKIYVLYVIIEFGIWAVILFKQNRKNGLFLVSLAVLLIIPVYKISEANDFVMRGTLSPMFVIMIFALLYLDKVIERFKNRGNTNDFKALGVFLLCLVMGITSYMFFITSVGASRQKWTGEDTSESAADHIGSFGDIHDEEFIEVVDRQFYVYDYNDTFFYKVFGKTE